MKFNQPKKPTEATIQAVLYNKLIKKGYKAYMEYTYKNARFDIIIVNKKTNDVMLAIEVKSFNSPNSNPSFQTDQFKKYAEFDIPVIFCTHMDNVNKTIKEVKEIFKLYRTLKKGKNKPW